MATQKISTEKFYKVLGFTQDVSICDCCGRTDLKGTIRMECIDGLAHFGTTCASKISGMTVKLIKDTLTALEIKAKEDARFEYLTSAEYKAHEAKLEELNAMPLKPFAERLKFLHETNQAKLDKRTEIKNKYNISGDTFIG